MKKVLIIILSMVVGLTVMDASLVDHSTKDNIESNLNLIYNGLYDTSNKIYNTNKFNCKATGCSTTNFNNLGLLSYYEFDRVGGYNSYIYNNLSFFIINNGNVEILNSNSDTGKIKPVTYLVPDTRVTGSGTITDPWLIYEETYYSYNISSIGGSVSQESGKIVKGGTLTIILSPDSTHKLDGVSSTCDGVINGNTLTISNIQSNIDCSVTFPVKTYYVSVSSSSGSVSPSSIYVSYGNSVRINLSPKTGYTLTGVTTTCKNGSISGSVLTISNVTQNISCTVTFPKIYYSYVITGYGGSVSPGSGSIEHGTSKTFTLNPSYGYTTTGATTTCNGTISGNKLTINNVTSSINCSVTFKKLYYSYVITGYGGSVSPGSGSIEHGMSKTFTLIPKDGYTTEGATTTCNGTISGNTLTINNVTSSINCYVTFMESSPYKDGSLAARILEDNPDVQERTNIGEANTDNTTGTIFKRSSSSSEQWTEDIDGDGIGEDVYYYSGNTTNNWVKFGGFYWRIIRINEDGSVRMLYTGTSHTTTTGYIGESSYNKSLGQSRYVGYMYGGTSSLADNRKNTTSSAVKTYLEKWYKNNLLSKYDSYISKTAIYCNDRAVGYGKWSNSGEYFSYASMRRLQFSVPSYRCGTNTTGGLYESTQAIEDKFSASTTGGGNGQLTYPIALMTGDEVMYAGGKRMTSLDSPYAWYYTNSKGQNVNSTDGFWLMSPESWQPESTYPYIHCVLGSKAPARLILSVLTDAFKIRPVISLKYCTQYSSGDGTASNPYTVSVDTTCANSVN